MTNYLRREVNSVKVKMFIGLAADVIEEFNKWAKGKALTKDIIIHTVPYPPAPQSPYHYILIAVYYPEGSQFDTTEEAHKHDNKS